VFPNLYKECSAVVFKRQSDRKDLNAGRKTVYFQQTVKTKVGKTVKFPILLAAITR
jgi:hypothetical protein